MPVWIIKLPLIIIWWAVLFAVGDGLSNAGFIIWVVIWVCVFAIVIKATKQ